MKRALVSATLTVGLLVCAATDARADDASEAALHFEVGSDLYRRRRYAEALEHFLAANRLVPNPSYAFNIAQTYELLRRPADAFNWYETFVRAPSISDADRADGAARQARLAPQLAIVDVSVEPAGATIYVDRRELGALGEAPRALAVPPGPHTILLELSDHEPASVDVVAAAGQRVEARVTLARRIGTLRVESSPPGAEVRLEDAPSALGITPLDVELPVGEHMLVVSRERHVSERRRVTIRSGETTEIAIGLARDAATIATLTVECTPLGAEVLLDGELLGAAPLTRDDLAPGEVTLTLRAPGHDAWQRVVALEAGGATHVHATLRDLSAEPWEGIAWIGYVGGGLLAGTAIALGAASYAEREAFYGALYTNPEGDQLGRVRDLALAADVVGAIAAALLTATFVWDLATGPAPPSRGEVEVAR